MPDTTPAGAEFRLQCRFPASPAPILAGVAVTGRLDGLLFDQVLRQTYRNTAEQLIEVVYTFPLPAGAVLLGFAAELNGQRREGQIVARAEAEQTYEQALADGDAPVLLEALPGGLYTANIGNLRPDDEIVVEARFAQVLRIEQGRLRLAIPTTIAPRYGNPATGGLQPQQVPEVDLAAECPLDLSLFVAGSFAGATVECPTHAVRSRRMDGGLKLELSCGAGMDRDVVFLITPARSTAGFITAAVDAQSEQAPQVRAASFPLPTPHARERIALKLLVDCSGSMAGDSIASARRALLGVVNQLTEHDVVSLSRFGATVGTVLAPVRCTALVRRRLTMLIPQIAADLGGTEMAAALRATFALAGEASSDGVNADVLILTDGEVWNAPALAADARARGHRVFAIGVGSAPAESVLRDLAAASGGACSFATPGEALEQAAQRMVERIRATPWQGLRVDWGAEPVWQTELPHNLVGGDQLTVFAGFAQSPTASPRLVVDSDGRTPRELARVEAAFAAAPAIEGGVPADSLARLAAAQRLGRAIPADGLELALRYRLISRYTHCVLVHLRTAEQRSTGEPELHRVGAMLAAGWSATGSVGGSMDLCDFGDIGYTGPAGAVGTESFFDAMEVSFERTVVVPCRVAACPPMGHAVQHGGKIAPQSAAVPGLVDGGPMARSPARVRQPDLPAASLPPLPRLPVTRDGLRHWARQVGDILAGDTSTDAWRAYCEAWVLHPRLADVRAETAGWGIDDADFGLLLVHWLTRQAAPAVAANLGVTVQPSVRDALMAGLGRSLDTECFRRGLALLDAELGVPGTEPPPPSRLHRLRRALARAVG
jgi:Ca-activated chloride channel family protein